MEFEPDYMPTQEVFTFWNGRLELFTITEVKMTINRDWTATIEYLLWTGSEHILVPENLCFEYESQVRAALEKRFEELSNQES